MKRSVTAIAAIAVGALALTACASTPATETTTPASSSGSGGSVDVAPRTIGVISISRSSPATLKTEEAITLAAEALGWDVEVVDANVVADTAAKAALNFVAQGVDGIIGLSLEASIIRQGLLDARAAGIATCEAGTVSDSDLYDAQYVDDNIDLGKTLMDHILDETPNAKVGILHATNNQAGLDRQIGVEQSLAEHPDATVVGDATPDLTDPTNATQKAVTDMITANPDLTSVYAVFDNFASGAVAAVRNARSSAKVWTYYGTPANVDALRNQPELGGLLDADLATTGLLCVDQFLRLFESGTPINPNELTDRGGLIHRVVTKDNIEEATSGGPVTFPNEELLDPFLEAWKQEFGTK